MTELLTGEGVASSRISSGYGGTILLPSLLTDGWREAVGSTLTVLTVGELLTTLAGEIPEYELLYLKLLFARELEQKIQFVRSTEEMMEFTRTIDIKLRF